MVRSPVRDPDDKPPFGGTWNRVYAAVVVFTVLLILALYWMTVTFNR
ncbi:MAG: hypothetical protein ABIG68_02215 [Acidobacteriota bacterium]